MKNKTLKGVLLASLLLGLVATAQATPIVYEKDIYQAGSNTAGSALEANDGEGYLYGEYGSSLNVSYPTDQPGGSKTIVWTFDVQTLGSAVLEIVAEGIDLGEEDLVTIIDPDGNETKLGSLTSQGFYYSGSYVWRGAGGYVDATTGITNTALTTSFFYFDILEVGTYTIQVTVAEPVVDTDGKTHAWVNEIETSKLTVTPVPEPATLSLLATGLLGLAAIGRRKQD